MTIVNLSQRTGKGRVEQILILARKYASERTFSRAFPDSGSERTAAENPGAEGASLPRGSVAAVHLFPRRPA